MRREPCRAGLVVDTLTLGRLVCAVRRGDVVALEDLIQKGALWSDPNPRLQDRAIQECLGTTTERFPLLWVAAFVGVLEVWKLVVAEISKHLHGVEDAMQDDVEGWLLPSVMCVAMIRSRYDGLNLLIDYFERLRMSRLEGGPFLYRCLFSSGHAKPLSILLARDEIVWQPIITKLVECGGGFPHDVPPEAVVAAATCLAYHRAYRPFFTACRAGGDAPRPGTLAFGGLFLGILDARVSVEASETALWDLIDAGLCPNAALTPAGLWPLHVAARRDSLHVVGALLAARANPFVKNQRGLTPMQVAREARSTSAIKALHEAASSPRRRPDFRYLAYSSMRKAMDAEDAVDAVAAAVST